jgi:hypothetical protein
VMIIGARVAADANSAFTTTWVGSDGNLYQMNATQVIAMSSAVSAHVDVCYATFASVIAQIKAGTITTTAQIDAAFAAQTT